MPKATTQTDPVFLSPADVAARTGKDERTIRRYCDEGIVPGAQFVGRAWIIPETSVASIPDRGRGWARGRKRTTTKGGET